MSYKVKILNGVLKLKTFSDVVLNILGIKDLGTQTGEVTSGYIDWSMQQYTQTTAQWNASTYILLKGQVGVEDTGTTTFKLKVGDGVLTWQQLGYISGGGANDFPENLYLTVVNKTGDNLLASGYKVLKVQTAQGQRLAVDYALADSDANSADTIGVVYENINNNQTGKIVVIGELIGLNTTGSLQGETWDDGDLLFLSPFVDGGITNIRPTAPNHGVRIGYVVYSHVNQGKIYIKIDNGYEIGELHNCYLPSPSNNDGIFWSSGTTRYENKSIASALGYTPENTLNKSIDGTFASNSDTLYPSQKAVKTYADSLVTGLLDDRGNYDASSNLFPSSGGSGTAGAILKGDIWFISTGGTLGGTTVVVGSSVRALVDSPAQTSSNWSILNVGVGYTPENSANKGIANGYASLDSSAKVPLTQIPSLTGYGYTLTFSALSFSPADSFNYFIGFQTTPITASTSLRMMALKTGTLKKAAITTRQTAGSSEDSTITLINGSNTYNLSTTIKFNSSPNNNYLITGLSINVTEGDALSIRLTTPAWATNPSNIQMVIVLYFE
jgi:hypothetical protein